MVSHGDEDLREAARARGFRLVKSRRRKPGGDFGRYGLADQGGRECLGFGPDGLTATAEEVRAYLRGGEVASWKRSLIGVVGADAAGEKQAGKSAPSPKRAGPAKQAAKANPAARPERSRGTPAPSPDPVTPSSPKAGKTARPTASKAPGSPSNPPGAAAKAAAPQEARPVTIREATRRDAAALARLLDLPAATLAERLAAAIRAEEPPLLAERDGIVGIAAYTIFQTLRHGPRARLTLLLVAEEERRQGLGTRLVEQVEQRLAEAGITALEMTLDIDFDAPTAFLRRTGWNRTTNGYAKVRVD